MKLCKRSSYARPPHQIEKLNDLVAVRKIRQETRLFAEIFKLTMQTTDPFIRLPIWRLTKVLLSPDHQYLTAKWTIDDPKDLEKYAKTLSEAFIKHCSVIRAKLAINLQMRCVPHIRFSYEDYSEIAFDKSMVNHKT